MQFEINIKPRRVTLETRTFKGKWIKYSDLTFETPVTPGELYAYLEIANTFGYGARAISSRGNQLMTTRASALMEALSTANLVSVVYKKIVESLPESSPENKSSFNMSNTLRLFPRPVLFSSNNKHFDNYTKLEHFFIDHKGIDYAKYWKETESDGQLVCFGVKMNDGSKLTLAAYY